MGGRFSGRIALFRRKAAKCRCLSAKINDQSNSITQSRTFQCYFHPVVHLRENFFRVLFAQ